MRAFRKLRQRDGSFRSLDLISGRLAPCVTSASFLPLFARACMDDEAEGLADILGEWSGKLSHLVPSTSPFASAFDPVRYWRGPVWLVVNRLIADGFAAYGQETVAVLHPARCAEARRDERFARILRSPYRIGPWGHRFLLERGHLAVLARPARP